MNVIKHLLTCLGEEGCEIAQACSKANRFGIHDVNYLEPQGPDNQKRIVSELNDLIAVADLCVRANILPENWQDPDAQAEKRKKVLKNMEYALSRNELYERTLTPTVGEAAVKSLKRLKELHEK